MALEAQTNGSPLKRWIYRMAAMRVGRMGEEFHQLHNFWLKRSEVLDVLIEENSCIASKVFSRASVVEE